MERVEYAWSTMARRDERILTQPTFYFIHTQTGQEKPTLLDPPHRPWEFSHSPPRPHRLSSLPSVGLLLLLSLLLPFFINQSIN